MKTKTQAGVAAPSLALDPYLNRDDLAIIFRRSKQTIDRWLKSGDLPPYDKKMGRSPLWRRETIEKFIRTGRVR